MAESTPAALSAVVPGGGGGAGLRLRSTSLVWQEAGMMRGRFSGFEKKAKTRSRGKGTHCSNSRWCMNIFIVNVHPAESAAIGAEALDLFFTQRRG